MNHQRGLGVQLYSLLNLRAREEWVVNATHRPVTPGKENLYTLYRRMDRPQDWSGRLRKSSPPPGLDPITVKQVAPRYID